MVGGIAAIRSADPGQIDRILDVALDGLRYTARAELARGPRYGRSLPFALGSR